MVNGLHVNLAMVSSQSTIRTLCKRKESGLPSVGTVSVGAQSQLFGKIQACSFTSIIPALGRPRQQGYRPV